MSAPRDRVVVRDGAYYASVNGTLYGAYAVRSYALAALATEQRRAQRRHLAAPPRQAPKK